MLKIGLTGGIASGKSETAKLFETLGTVVIDTDQLAREVLKPGSSGLEEVAETFGKHYLLGDGSLDRRALRHTIFSDPAARQRLEAITHPRIIALLRERLASLSKEPYVIVEIPLLSESGLAGEMDRILVVDTSEEAQIQRLMLRDNESRSEAQAALKAQADRLSRLDLANDIITNVGDLENLEKEVLALHGLYLGMARQRSGGA
jgi:dephospho-CoA kinase